MSDFKVKNYNIILNLVGQSKLANFFHRYEWLRTIESEIELGAKHIGVQKNLYPIDIFPNFIINIKKTSFKHFYSTNPRFGDHIMVDREKEFLDLMFKNISKICKGTIMSHTSSRINNSFFKFKEEFGRRVIPTLSWKIDYSVFWLNLLNVERLSIKNLYDLNSCLQYN